MLFMHFFLFLNRQNGEYYDASSGDALVTLESLDGAYDEMAGQTFLQQHLGEMGSAGNPLASSGPYNGNGAYGDMAGFATAQGQGVSHGGQGVTADQQSLMQQQIQQLQLAQQQQHQQQQHQQQHSELTSSQGLLQLSLEQVRGGYDDF
jgi:hypothetical protein